MDPTDSLIHPQSFHQTPHSLPPCFRDSPFRTRPSGQGDEVDQKGVLDKIANMNIQDRSLLQLPKENIDSLDDEQVAPKNQTDREKDFRIEEKDFQKQIFSNQNSFDFSSQSDQRNSSEQEYQETQMWLQRKSKRESMNSKEELEEKEETDIYQQKLLEKGKINTKIDKLNHPEMQEESNGGCRSINSKFSLHLDCKSQILEGNSNQQAQQLYQISNDHLIKKKSKLGKKKSIRLSKKDVIPSKIHAPPNLNHTLFSDPHSFSNFVYFEGDKSKSLNTAKSTFQEIGVKSSQILQYLRQDEFSG